MFTAIFYFILAYLASALMFWPIKRLLIKWGRGRAAVCGLGMALVCLPWLPYGVVAAQTALFGNMLLPSVRHVLPDCDGMCGEKGDPLFTYQVLWITPWVTEVYLVTPCTGGMLPPGEQGRRGTVVTLTMTRHGWRFADADTPWSDCGSADGNIFPPDPQAL